MHNCTRTSKQLSVKYNGYVEHLNHKNLIDRDKFRKFMVCYR
jgi:hypothetical protein